MRSIPVLSIEITPATHTGRELTWSPQEEEANSKKAVNIASSLCHYCETRMPKSWRESVDFLIVKGVQDPKIQNRQKPLVRHFLEGNSIEANLWVEAHLIAQLSDNFDELDAFNSFVIAVHKNFKDGCILLDQIPSINPSAPGSVPIVSGNWGISDGAVFAPKEVAELARLIRNHCSGNNPTPLRVSAGEESCEVKYSEPATAVVSDDGKPVLFTGEVTSVCDSRQIIEFRVRGEKKMQLSFYPELRDNLLKSQMNYR